MKYDTATRALSVTNDCSARIRKSLDLANKLYDETTAAKYKRIAARLDAHLFMNIMAPIYEEHQSLAPEWYMEMNKRKK